jgi:hypothetical protein
VTNSSRSLWLALRIESFLPLQVDECFLAAPLSLLLKIFDVSVYRLARHAENAGEIRGRQERILQV